MSTLDFSTQRLVGFGLLALLAVMLLVVAYLEWRDTKPARPARRGWRRRQFACGDPDCPLCTKTRVPLTEAIDYTLAHTERRLPGRAR